MWFRCSGSFIPSDFSSFGKRAEIPTHGAIDLHGHLMLAPESHFVFLAVFPGAEGTTGVDGFSRLSPTGLPREAMLWQYSITPESETSRAGHCGQSNGSFMNGSIWSRPSTVRWLTSWLMATPLRDRKPWGSRAGIAAAERQ